MMASATIQPSSAKEQVIYNKTFILLTSTIAALGGLLFGFDTAIISGTLPFIKPYFGMDAGMEGWAASSLLLGCCFGAFLSGSLSDHWGRKPVLFVCAVLFTISGIGTGLADTYFVFICFRLVGGLAVGSAAMVAPMYIAKIAPGKLRGRLVGIYQLAVVLGILLSYLSNYLLADIGENNWRWMFMSQAAPSLVFFLALFGAPESPRWLIKKARDTQALEVLSKIGGKAYARDELHQIEQSFESGKSDSWKAAFLPKYRLVLWIGVVVAVFSQITGINAILYYAPVIFSKTGVSTSNSLLQTVAIGVIMMLFTFLAIALVDKTGRKKLLLWGNIAMFSALTGVGLCFRYDYFSHYLVLIFILLYIAAFSATVGAVTWVYLSEIFPNRIRGVALSISTLALWLADFVVILTFPLLRESPWFGTANTLFLYAGFCLIYIVYISKRVPETKGQTLERLEHLFVH